MTREFKPTLEGLEQCRQFLEELCPDPKPAIILDEIVSNIVRCARATMFRVGYERATNGEATLTFVDDGVPFDPLNVPPPDVTASAGDREIGGLGIFMVRKMSKRVDYRREADQNRLTVVF